MRKMDGNEKTYLILIVVVLLLLIIKSFVLDEYKPQNEIEIQIYNEYYSTVERSNILKYKRIVDIAEIDPEKKPEEQSLKYNYKIKIREYLFGVLPYWEISDYIYD